MHFPHAPLCEEQKIFTCEQEKPEGYKISCNYRLLAYTEWFTQV